MDFTADRIVQRTDCCGPPPLWRLQAGGGGGDRQPHFRPRVNTRSEKGAARCAQQCAQTRSDNQHSAPNANQAPNKKRARNRRFQARSVIPGSLSKPPPSASRPPHRASASIRDTATYAEVIHGERGGGIPAQTVAIADKFKH